jgi:HEAT repeat protein
MEKKVNSYCFFREVKLKEVLIDNLQPKKQRQAKYKKILAEAEMADRAHTVNQPWFGFDTTVTQFLSAHLRIDPTWNYPERWLDNIEFSSITVANGNIVTVAGSLWWGYNEDIDEAQTPEALEAEFVLAEEQLSYSIKLYADGLCRHITNAGITRTPIEALETPETGVTALLTSLKNKGENAPPKSPAIHMYLGTILHNINYLTAYTIAQSGTQGIQVLLKLLEDKDIELQNAAVYALGLVGEKAHPAIPVILGVMPDANQQFRCMAAVALCRITNGMGENFALMNSLIPDLLKALNEQSYDDKYLFSDTLGFARRTLTELARQDHGLIALFIQAFENGEAPSALSRIFYDLGNIAREAIPVLVKAINDPESKNQRGAAYALSHMGIEGIQIIVQKLRNEDKNVRHMAAFVIEECAREGVGDLKIVIPELIQALKGSKDAKFCCAIALSLAHIDLQDGHIIETLNTVTPSLIRVIQHPESFTARLAIETLGLIGTSDTDVIPALIELLQDKQKDRYCRNYALRALCTIGVDTNIMTLLLTEILKENDGVCEDAIDILMAWGSPEALAALLVTMSEILKAKNSLGFSHCKAFQALHKIGTASIPLLVDLSQSDNRHIYIGAVRTLGYMGRRAVPYLIQALANLDTRATAVEALGKIGADASAAIESLEDALSDADLNTVARAIEALGRIGKPAVPALIRALKGEDSFIAMWAAAVLGRMGRDASEAIPALVEALHHTDAQVRELATRALHQQGETLVP